MDRRRLARVGAVISAMAALAGCTSSAEEVATPGLEPRGTVLTTVKPTRQDLTNRISLTGKVTINPVFGIVAPVKGELRYMQRERATTPATEALWVATVWDKGIPHRVRIPKGSTMAGRLMEDRSAVSAGMPIVSARHAAYGIVADIDSAQAYRISGAVESVQGQIKNGPGPFPCTPLGTIAALPAGTVPPAPTATPTAQASRSPGAQPQGDVPPAAEPGGEGS
ncbi:MAG TPA: efflux RND transporter periplasmic adaptor subunit, partial [Catenuloplanes sp.]